MIFPHVVVLAVSSYISGVGTHLNDRYFGFIPSFGSISANDLLTATAQCQLTRAFVDLCEVSSEIVTLKVQGFTMRGML